MKTSTETDGTFCWINLKEFLFSLNAKKQLFVPTFARMHYDTNRLHLDL
jgi:hypothetical protein